MKFKVLLIIFVLFVLGNCLERKGDKDVIEIVKEEDKGADQIRLDVLNYIPEEKNIIQFLSDKVKLIEKYVPVKSLDWDDFVDIVAQDDENYEKNNSKALSKAQLELEMNECLAFTNLKGEIYILNKAPETYKNQESRSHDEIRFDLLHEYVHALSAPGGYSRLHNFNAKFNDAGINYFTEEIAKFNNYPVFVRYEKQTNGMRYLKNLMGANPNTEIFNLVFKFTLPEFMRNLTVNYLAMEKNPNGQNKVFSQKKLNLTTGISYFTELCETNRWEIIEKFFKSPTSKKRQQKLK